MRVVIVGAGGHGRAVAETLIAGGAHEVVGFVDDMATGTVWTIPVLGTVSDLAALRRQAGTAIVAIGNNSVRRELHRKLSDAGFELGTAIHPSAIVSSRAIVDRGCSIMAGAIVGTEATLGEGVIVNSGAIVEHHCVVEDFAHLGAGAVMAGGSKVGAGAWLQAGAAIGYRVRISPGEVLHPGEWRSCD